jgi:hypothetical protein
MSTQSSDAQGTGSNDSPGVQVTEDSTAGDLIAAVAVQLTANLSKVTPPQTRQ